MQKARFKKGDIIQIDKHIAMGRIKQGIVHINDLSTPTQLYPQGVYTFSVLKGNIDIVGMDAYYFDILDNIKYLGNVDSNPGLKVLYLPESLV